MDNSGYADCFIIAFRTGKQHIIFVNSKSQNYCYLFVLVTSWLWKKDSIVCCLRFILKNVRRRRNLPPRRRADTCTVTVHAHEQTFRHKMLLLRSSKGTYNRHTVSFFYPKRLFIFSKRSDRDYISETELCINEIWKNPAQMFEVAGDPRRAPAKFENPA